MARIDIDPGNVFFGMADLIIVPCSSSGAVPGIYHSELTKNGWDVAAPGGRRGVVIFDPVNWPPKYGKSSKFIAYAAMQVGNTSGTAMLHDMGKQIGDICKKYNEIKRIRLPIMLSDSDMVSISDVFTHLSLGFLESEPNDAALIFCAENPNEYELATKAYFRMMNLARQDITGLVGDVAATIVSKNKVNFLNVAHADSILRLMDEGLNLLLAISETNLDLIPDLVLLESRHALKNLYLIILNILNTINSNGRQNISFETVRELNDAYSIAFKRISAAISLANQNRQALNNIKADVLTQYQNSLAEVEKLKLDIEMKSAGALKKADEAVQKIESNGVAVQKIADKIHSTAGYVTADIHGNFFSQQAKTHKFLSLAWLVITAIFGIGLFSVVYIIFDETPYQSKDIWDFLMHTSHTALLVGTCLFGLIWSARNYKSNVHNWIVSSHRKNVVSTYISLSAALENDKESRAVILNKSADAMFSPLPTGYMHGKEDDPQPILQAFNVNKPTEKEP